MIRVQEMNKENEDRRKVEIKKKLTKQFGEHEMREWKTGKIWTMGTQEGTF